MGAVSAIGTVLTALDKFDSKIGIFNKVFGRNDQTNLKQLREKNRLTEQLNAQQAALAAEKAAAEAEHAETERLQALRRAVARQRASFGAQGIGSSGGSSEAVLLGMFEESDIEKADRERLDTLRDRIADQKLQKSSSLNLLKETQLAEKQKLQRFYL